MQNKILIVFFCIFSAAVFAEGDFKYFNDGINYWPTPIKKQKVEKKQKQKSSSFNWSKYLNPKNDEFFKEGNYTPPAPFMELARNPTDQNIKNWIAYNNLKNKLSQKLKERMQTYLIKNADGNSENKEKAMTIYKRKAEQLQESPIDPSRYRVRMFFNSKCSHCKRMFGTLVELQNAGIYVEALQTDKEKSNYLKYPIPIRSASPDEIKHHKIETVPFTLIANLKKKVLYPPLKGYQSMSTVMNLLREAEKL